MVAYIQRCKLCGSDGKVKRVRECSWCQGNGVKGNGAAATSDGQIHLFRDPWTAAMHRATVGQ